MSTPRIPLRRLVLVGSILVDILMYIDHLPERGGDSIAQRALLTSGGGFNVLVGAKRLGMPVAHAGRVGDGPMGAQVAGDLASAGIPLMLPRVFSEDTGFDIGLVEPDAERTFVTSPGAESRLGLDDLNAIPLQTGDAIYVSGYDLCYPVSGASLEAWLPALPSRYVLVFDPGPLVAEIPSKRLEQVLARSDIVSLNAREITLLTGKSDIPEAARRLVPRIAPGGYVIARAGAQGCWIASKTVSPCAIPARTAHAVDTTGAGDTHVAALLARLSLGDDISTAARAANIAASISVERVGPATGPTLQELEYALAG
ncbi:MAG TPA: PfkB family carbohydrate kinase [Ktedonobacteraceae bacterium]